MKRYRKMLRKSTRAPVFLMMKRSQNFMRAALLFQIRKFSILPVK